MPASSAGGAQKDEALGGNERVDVWTSRVDTAPPGMEPLALAPGLGPSIRLCKATSHPSSLYFLTYRS